MLQIIDISNNVLYNKSVIQNQFLSIINATVSHEMRNPLNSILAENAQKEELLNQLKELLSNKNLTFKEFLDEASNIVKKFEKSIFV